MLQDADSPYQAVFDAARDAMIVYTRDGVIVEANAAACRTYGYTREELIGLDAREAVHPDARPHFEEFLRVVGGGGEFRCETVDRRRDGTAFPIEVTGTHYTYGGQPRLMAVVRDIGEQKRAEAALRVSEERLRAVFEQTGAGIAQADLTGRFILVNERYAQIVGRSREELLGLRLQDITHPEDLPHNLALLEGALRDGQPFVIEKRYVRPDGSAVWVSNSVSLMRGRDGRPSGVIAATVDVTDRRRAEQALRESEQRFRLMADAVPQIVWITDAEGRVQFFNQQWSRYTGLDYVPATADDVAATVIHPEDQPATKAAFDAALRSGETFAVEHRIRSAAGEYRWFLVRGEPYRDPQTGRVARWFGASVDIHDRKVAEERSRTILESINDAFYAVDADFRFTYVNRKTEQLWGRRREELLGRPYWTEFPKAVGSESHRMHLKVMAERTPVQYETISPLLGRWIDVSIYPEAAGGLSCYFRDITDRKRAEAERQALLEAERTARAEAERASRMKDEFLATLSHELRTPLNAILGWSQILAAGSRDEDDLAEGLRTIERNARAQTEIIEDLLDMSRIISGKVRLDVQRMDLAPVVKAAIDTVRPAADAKGIRVQTVLDPLAGPVGGDPGRLQQVFWNLLTNAVKFTPKGGRVQVLLERVNSHLEVSVTDTGEGIPPEFLPHVFDRFRQADASTTRRHGGLGLGLNIVKQLVELHGGGIRVTSAGAGRGSTFTVSLPLTVIHPEPRPEVERRHPSVSPSPLGLPDGCVRIAGVKVLVVDDEPDARALVKRLLEDCEGRVVTAGSASDAVHLVRTERPDVLLCDIGMPGEDGYSLIRRVRALGPEHGGQVPAAALTAYARPEDRVRATAAGFQTHLAKPVEPAELIATVASLAGRAG